MPWHWSSTKPYVISTPLFIRLWRMCIIEKWILDVSLFQDNLLKMLPAVSAHVCLGHNRLNNRWCGGVLFSIRASTPNFLASNTSNLVHVYQQLILMSKENALTHWPLGNLNFILDIIIFKRILVINGWDISCKITLIWMSLDFTDDQSILVQVMACCHQATSHYLSQCWLRSLWPYGVTRPQQVNFKWHSDWWCNCNCIAECILLVFCLIVNRHISLLSH